MLLNSLLGSASRGYIIDTRSHTNAQNAKTKGTVVLLSYFLHYFIFKSTVDSSLKTTPTLEEAECRSSRYYNYKPFF